MNIKNTIKIVLCLALVVVVVSFTNWRHNAAERAYQAYEECVISEYGTTPAAYYAEHGETPEC
jgi:hypothetical protein